MRDGALGKFDILATVGDSTVDYSRRFRMPEDVDVIAEVLDKARGNVTSQARCLLLLGGP